MLYISTSVWVLRTRNPAGNMLVSLFCMKNVKKEQNKEKREKLSKEMCFWPFTHTLAEGFIPRKMYSCWLFLIFVIHMISATFLSLFIVYPPLPPPVFEAWSPGTANQCETNWLCWPLMTLHSQISVWTFCF